MLQARLLLVALLIPAAGAFALLGGTSMLHGAAVSTIDASVSVTTGALRGAMSRFSSATVDAAARAATDRDVAAALVAKALTPKVEAALLAPAGAFGAPTFALAVDADGNVVGRAGAETELPTSLKGLPVVAEALAGIARDGVWLEDEKPVHLAAAAAYDGAAAVGGIVLGWQYTDELAAQLSPDKATIPTFVVSQKTIAGRLSEGVTADLVRAREPFGSPSAGGFFPVFVPDSHRYNVAVAQLYPPDDAVVATALIDRDVALEGVASFQKALIGLTLALGLLIVVIIATTLRAVSKPIEIIVDHLALLQQGSAVGILPEAGLTGPFLRLGKQINVLIQHQSAPPRGGTAPLMGGGLFGSPAPVAATQPPPPPPDAPLSFSSPASTNDLGFSARPSTNADALGASFPAPPPSPASGIAAAFAAPPSNSPPPPQPPPPTSPAGLAGLFDEPDPLAAFRVPPKAPPPPVAPPPPPPPVPPFDHEMNPEATVMFQVPQSLLQASSEPLSVPPTASVPPSVPPSAAPPLPPFQAASDDSGDDNRTVVAQVPRDLLTATAQPANASGDAADQAHYREVYEKFLKTRIECGEDTSDLTIDRFIAKLLKNRQQILEKHKAKGVRFQVYVKDGKAALRALPVRE
jgi:hypothetical protein